MSRLHPHLYEINTVPWLHELSEKLGGSVTLANVPEIEWVRLRDLGFDYVWLMGVWQKSEAGRKIFQGATELYSVYDAALPGWTAEDVIGSPYSISDYRPDARVGSWDDLKEVRAKLHDLNMGLILDFVPNHVGPDHDWVTQHPEYFIQGSEQDFEKDPKAFFEVTTAAGETCYIAKGKDPYFAPWQDTVQINYFHPAAREAMINTLKEIESHCEGVRCDMAMLVLNDIFHRTWERLLDLPPPPTEFWTVARQEITDMILIAEAYWDTEWTLQQLGFDYVYDKRLYDRSRFSAARDIHLHLTADLSYQSKLLRFVENHDEPRSAAEFPRGRLQAATALFGTLPGLRLYHHGQLEGRKIQLPVQMLRIQHEEVDQELLDFHTQLLLQTDHRCFHDGEWTLLEAERFEDDTHQELICYLWGMEDEMRLVVVNFGTGHSQARISLHPFISAEKEYQLEDLLSGESYLRSGAEMADGGLHVVLKAYQTHILEISEAGSS